MRRYVTIFVLVMLAVLVAWFFLVWTPQSNNIEETAQAADDAEGQARRLTLEVARLEDLEKNAPALRERAAKADTAIPSEPQLAQFILQVQEAADASGVEWVSVTPTPPAVLPEEAAGPQERGVLQVELSMSVEGGYFQVQDFITRLETLSRAVKVLKIALTAGAQEVTTLQATMSMRMFVSATTSTPAPSAGGS